MFGKIAVFLTTRLLRITNLSISNRTELVNELLSKLQAIPAKAILGNTEEGTMTINGRPVVIEEARKLRDGCLALLDNSARRILREQIIYKATELAFKNGVTPEQMYFGRAAMWMFEQEDELAKLLVQDESPQFPQK